MPKLKCKNKYCKFHRENGCSKKSVTLDRKGSCETYEPGFAYYFFYCCEHMQTNFLTYPEVNAHPAYKYSIYYMTKCLPVECYNDDIRGMLVICDNQTQKPLNANDLIELMNDNLDENALNDCVDDYLKNGLPKAPETKGAEMEKIVEKEYGWLSPNGVFYPSEWGTHELAAQELCRDLIGEDTYPPCRDELIRRGWALIHDPSLAKVYLVTNQKPLTKKQRDFLYGYFKDMGMTSRAELYQKEDGSGMLQARGAEE